MQKEASSKSSAIIALIMGTLAMAGCFMAWSSFAPLAAQIQETLGLSMS